MKIEAQWLVFAYYKKDLSALTQCVAIRVPELFDNIYAGNIPEVINYNQKTHQSFMCFSIPLLKNLGILYEWGIYNT